MRRSLLDNLPTTAAEDELPETDKGIARAAMVASFGPRTSAWLIRGHRRQLHAQGAVRFVVPERPNKVIAEKLRWFFIAMDFLRKRVGWDLEVTARKGKRTFYVRWLGWGHWGADRASRAS